MQIHNTSVHNIRERDSVSRIGEWTTFTSTNPGLVKSLSGGGTRSVSGIGM